MPCPFTRRICEQHSKAKVQRYHGVLSVALMLDRGPNYQVVRFVSLLAAGQNNMSTASRMLVVIWISLITWLSCANGTEPVFHHRGPGLVYAIYVAPSVHLDLSWQKAAQAQEWSRCSGECFFRGNEHAWRPAGLGNPQNEAAWHSLVHTDLRHPPEQVRSLARPTEAVWRQAWRSQVHVTALHARLHTFQLLQGCPRLVCNSQAVCKDGAGFISARRAAYHWRLS